MQMISAIYVKTVRNAKEHFSFFLFHCSFLVEKKISLVRKEEGKGKKEKCHLLISKILHYAQSSFMFIYFFATSTA
jgi:hypothetical protein